MWFIVNKCNFIGNYASFGGGFYSEGYLNVDDCNFNSNNAFYGSAISCYGYFNRMIRNSYFLDNKANSTTFNITENNNGIEITFIGQNNLLNAIYCPFNEISFKNVTYWGANGINNTGNSAIYLKPSLNEVGQNVTLVVYKEGLLLLNTTKVTDSNGKIFLEDIFMGSYNITARHDDLYYTFIESNKIITIKSPTEINIEKETVILNAGEKVATGASLIPVGAGNLTYSSNDSSVAYVENDEIIAIGKGKVINYCFF